MNIDWVYVGLIGLCLFGVLGLMIVKGADEEDDWLD